MEKDYNNWKPEVFQTSNPEHAARLKDLSVNPKVEFVDRIDQQLSEYLKLKNPGKALTEEEIASGKSDVLDKWKVNSLNDFGNWVYYPWHRMVVHLLPEDLFVSVRTDRNRNKITREEQQLLAQKKIGVIGMSVGRSVAVTMAMERIFGELRLADFDELDLSNLNRLKAPVWDLGLRKTISVARDIFETDPYLNIRLFHDGVTNENIEEFALQNGKLDLIVDECDSLDVKISVRKFAKEHRIPVIMETSDRGMLDVERFDLEPDRPLFHGLIDHIDLDKAMSDPKMKWELLMSLVDFPSLSDRAQLSLKQIGTEISTWPQLASSVMLGGGTVTDSARRLLLGEEIVSGRYYIDVNKIIQAKEDAIQ